MNKVVKYGIIVLAISILTELFIYNSQEIAALFAKEKNIKVDYVIEQRDEIEKDDKIPIGVSNIIINNIGIEVYNVVINFKQDYKKILKYSPSAYVYGSSKQTLKYESKSKIIKHKNSYINIKTDSIANKIIIEVDNQNNQKFTIENITLNHQKLHINYLRILIIFLIIFTIVLIKKFELYKIPYNDSSKQEAIYYIVVLAICLCIEVYCVAVNNREIIRKEPQGETMLLQAEAFINGQIDLLIKPSKELLRLENPYDRSLREKESVEYLWDVALYKGKYYQYYTVIPVVFIIVPFKLITGYYLTTFSISIMLLIITIVLISILFKMLLKRYCIKTSFFNLIISLITIILGTNLLYLIRADKYEICELLALLNLTLSFIFILNIEQQKNKNTNIILAGITTGLLVISKPIYIFWYILIIPLIIKILYKQYNKNTKKYTKKIIIYFLPIIILGILQMIYNYIRFDNILEFGQSYQLTVYDNRILMQLSLPRILKGLVVNIFTMPIVNLKKFPFIFMMDNVQEITTDFGSITFNAYPGVVGLLGVPILWILLFKNKFLDNKDKNIQLLIKIIFIISILVFIGNTVGSGISEQYTIQCKIPLVILSILTALKGLEKRKLSNKLFIYLCIMTILIMVPIGASTFNRWLETDQYFIVKMRDLFEWWN